MFGAAEMTDKMVAAAAEGSQVETERLAAVLTPQIRLMVAARLGATPRQFHAVEELGQQVMMGLVAGISRLDNRTVNGLKAYASRIVSNKVADYLKKDTGRGGKRPRVRSLDSTVAGLTEAGPLWQLLSADGTSPVSAVARADKFNLVLNEMQKLKPEYCEIITLAFFDQLETAEIAKRLGLTRPAASMRLIRAVNTLRSRVTDSDETA